MCPCPHPHPWVLNLYPESREASEGKQPVICSQKWSGRPLEEVANAFGGGCCRLQMPLKLALAAREIAARHRLVILEIGVPRFQCIPADPAPLVQAQPCLSKASEHGTPPPRSPSYTHALANPSVLVFPRTACPLSCDVSYGTKNWVVHIMTVTWDPWLMLQYLMCTAFHVHT